MENAKLSVMVKYCREYLLYLSILTFALAFVYAIPPASCTARQERWYAGYAFKGVEWSAPSLTSGKIKFVLASGFPATGDFCYEWMCIILDYEPNLYWIQSGWAEIRLDGSVIGIGFYVEVFDSEGWDWDFVDGTPEVGHTYEFTICRVRSTNKYQVVIYDDPLPQLYSGFFYVDPYIPRDQQAFVETNSPDIDIGTSHFSDLRYRSGRYTYNWYTHVAAVDEPYVLQEISHYEFKAWRG